MKLSRKAVIAIVLGVVILVAVVVFAVVIISNNAAGASISGTPTRQFGRFGGTPGAGGFNGTPGAGGFNGTPGAGGFNGTPGAGRGRLTGTPTVSSAVSATLASTATPPITPTFTFTPTFTATATVVKPFSLYYLSSPVKVDQGGVYASAQALTAPGNTCVLTFANTDGKMLNMAGTGATQADSVGICLWSWLIPGGTKPGTATVTITVNQYTLSFPMVVQ